MAVKVIIPTPLRPYRRQAGERRIAGQPPSAKRSNGLTTRFAICGSISITDDGRLRSFVNVYVNDEDIRYLQKEKTPLRDGDIVSIVPSIAGGAPN